MTQKYQNFLLQRYNELIERLSQIDKVSKICIVAGFLSVVEIGQYFITKDNEEKFMQRRVVNILFQEMMDHHNRKDVSKET